MDTFFYKELQDPEGGEEGITQAQSGAQCPDHGKTGS
jgi:hypothetical protein